LIFVGDLLTSHESAKVLSDGARIAIVGSPNSGKSTLFNSLLNYQRAIVTNSPGTTRDTIEESLYISNYSVLLIDTAGIRKTTNQVELAGIEKSNHEIKKADLIYCVLDLSTNIEKPKLKTSTPIIYIYNKVDLVGKKEINNIKKEGDNIVFISAKTQEGFHSLKEKTGLFLGSIINKSSEFYITSARQKNILNNIKTILEKALGGEAINEIELLAFELKLAIEQFDWLLGKTTADDILNNLFSDFCVGK
jgi:tRNA modification GTPase